MKFIPFDKLSKKEKKKYNKRKRITNGFNTGTRILKSKKDYNRQNFKHGED